MEKTLPLTLFFILKRREEKRREEKRREEKRREEKRREERFVVVFVVVVRRGLLRYRGKSYKILKLYSY